MKAPARLGLYGLLLAVVFALSAVVAGAVVPEEVVQDWVQETEEISHSTGNEHDSGEADDSQDDSHEDDAQEGSDDDHG